MEESGKQAGVAARHRVRRAACVAALLAVTFLCVACGTSSTSGVAHLSSTSSATTSAVNGTSLTAESTQEKLLKFSECVRSHGVSNFPDPGSTGGFTPSQLNALKSSPALKPALIACESDLPTNGAANNPEIQTTVLKFAECMHAHGVPNFPEPGSSSKSTSSSLDTSSPQFQRATQACQSLLSPIASGSSGG